MCDLLWKIWLYSEEGLCRGGGGAGAGAVFGAGAGTSGRGKPAWKSQDLTVTKSTPRESSVGEGGGGSQALAAA